MRGKGGRGSLSRIRIRPVRAYSNLQCCRCSFSLSLFLPPLSIFLSLWKVREERRQARNLGATNSRLAGRPTDPFDHETCLLVIIARRFASPRGRVPRLVANAGCIIADASMRLARRYRINRNSREPCLFRLYALYTLYTHTHARGYECPFVEALTST